MTKKTDYNNEDLSNQSFAGKDLSGFSFKGAILRGTNFAGAILKNCDFTGAVTNDTLIIGADVKDAINLPVEGVVTKDNLRNKISLRRHLNANDQTLGIVQAKLQAAAKVLSIAVAAENALQTDIKHQPAVASAQWRMNEVHHGLNIIELIQNPGRGKSFAAK